MTTDSHIVSVRLIRNLEEVVGYVLGYVTKPLKSHLLHDLDRFQELIAAMTGRRTVITFGDWHALDLWKHENLEGFTYLCGLGVLIDRVRAGDQIAFLTLTAVVTRNGPWSRWPASVRCLVPRGP